MPRFTDAELDELKQRVDLPALIRARGVELKAHGDGHLAGKCPFHADDTPSFIVTPAKGLFHCLGCGAAGNAIQFVMKADGISFRHAVELLRGDPAKVFAPLGYRARVLPCPLDVEADDATLLAQVVEYYHERLLASPVATEYLKARGLGDVALWKKFRLGYADRSLGLRLPTANTKPGRVLRERLTRLGVYRESGHEHLNGCIVVPIFGEQKDAKTAKAAAGFEQEDTEPAEIGRKRSPGDSLETENLKPETAQRVLNLYGRRLLKDGVRHLYLPGPRRGIFNRTGAELTSGRRVILCESILDALSFVAAGIHGVTTAYGVEGFTDELETFLSQHADTVLIAYDRDEPGERGAEKAAARLMVHGIECHRVKFPPNTDANEFLCADPPTAPERFATLITGAEWLGRRSPAGLTTEHTEPTETSPGEGGMPEESPVPETVAVPRVAPAPSSLAAHRLAAEHASATAGARLSPAALPNGHASSAAKDKKPSFAPANPPAPTPAREATEGSRASGEISALSAPLREPLPASVSSVSSVVPELEILRDTPEEILLSCGDREYRIRGLAKNTGFETLRVSLRVAFSARWHLDTLDLCRAKERATFIEAAAAETALKPDLLRRDLGRVLLQLETLQETRLRAEVAPLEKTGPVMSDADRDAALEFLKAPDLLARIVADFAACGVVGEETNKLTGYLAAVSRKLDRPLAVIVQSTSAAGKSALMEAVLELMPPEEKTKYSALTGQALFYLGESDLQHKILAVIEEEGAERASYALKLLNSEGELSIASTGKDPVTGRMVTQEYRVQGPVMIFLTTTAADIDEELLNRCLVLTVDEGRAQTAAIHRLQRERETLAGLLRREDKSKILAKHHAAQRLLRPLAVVNPFAEQLTFRDDRTRTRRDHMKYLGLIRAIAYLHQFQRPIKTAQHAGKTLSYIEVTLADIESANRLAHEVLGRCLDEMPPQTRRLLGLLDGLVSEAARERKCAREDIRFTRREVRDATGWGDTQLKLHLGRLAELEFLATHRIGCGFSYELLYRAEATTGNRFMPGLPDLTKLKPTYDANRSGGEGDRSGSAGERSPLGRPTVGGVSGGGRLTPIRTTTSAEAEIHAVA